MIDLIILFAGHFVADFILQPREMAMKKSEEWKVLISHCMIIFGVIFVAVLICTDFSKEAARGAMILAGLNAIIHGAIDRNIWKAYKRRAKRMIEEAGEDEKENDFAYWEDHWFYLTIGFDQFLHSATLIGLYFAI